MKMICARVSMACLGLCLIGGLGTARADVISFIISPAASFVQVDFDSTLGTMIPQAAGSLQTTLSGTITVDVDDPTAPGSIAVQGASVVVADNGSWGPGPAPANVGGVVETAITDPRDVAMRNMEVDIQGAAQPLTAGQFDASQLSLTMTSGQMDYAATTIFGFFNVPGGSSALTGAGQNGSSEGSVTVAGSDLVFAMNLTFQFTGTMNGIATPYQLSASVEAVAQNAAAVPEPTTGLLFMAGLLGLVANRLRQGARISRESST